MMFFDEADFCLTLINILFEFTTIVICIYYDMMFIDDADFFRQDDNCKTKTYQPEWCIQLIIIIIIIQFIQHSIA